MAPQSTSVTAPATLSQPSRKGKKAWRKNVDISEVTAGIEELREEIRTTGGPVAEQSDDQLFTADTAGDEEIQRRHRLTKPLKVDQILAQRSAINAQNLLDTDDQGGVGDGGAGFDLWATTTPDSTSLDVATAVVLQNNTQAEENEYIPKPKAKVAPPTIRRAPIPMTASGKPAKAVASPDEGTSYNPAFEAWAALIERVGEKEVAAEEARRAKAQADAERQARIDQIAAQPDTEAGYDTGMESAWEGFDESDGDDAAAQGYTTVDAPLRRRRLGPTTIPEQQLEVVLPEELQDSLRRLKPEGNLMTDRFRTLLVNGKLEARKRVLQPRKRKVKVTEKWSYKDFELPRIKA
ncbi:hypothetical protein DV738_g4914, partial [Chaetothyriales sp. CBS 135597]